jgi:hypothetical protein
MTTFNYSPYFDDYSADKDYYKILFKPGYSVQARELTQIQSILQNQVKSFGNHVFRQGSLVVPGNSYSDLAVPYVKLQPTGLLDVTSLIGEKITGSTSGVVAVIKLATKAIDTDPDTLYVGYMSGSGAFLDGEPLTIGSTTLYAASNNSTGLGSVASITDGVYYVNGIFANVAKQTVVIGKYTTTPSCHVLLQIIEEVINSDLDTTLLDPANGSYNFSAPGADRFKLSLIMTSLPVLNDVGSNVTEDYIELMRFRDGILEEHARFAKYNELEKSLARRTYDESGDYVANGLDVSIREHLKTRFNTGLFNEAQGGDSSLFAVNVAPGKAYIKGFETELLAKSAFAVAKARTADHVKTRAITITPSFGQFLYVSDILKLPDTNARETVKLFSYVGGTEVGTAKVIAVDFQDANDVNQNWIYKFFITDVVMTGGASLTSVGYMKSAIGASIGKVLHKFSVPSSGVNFVKDSTITVTGLSRSAIVWKWDKTLGEMYVYRSGANSIPIVNDLIVSSAGSATVATVTTVGNYLGNSSVIPLNIPALKTVGTTNVSYKVYKSISASTTLNSATLSIGNVTGITIDPLEAGNFIIVGPTGVQSTGLTLNGPGTAITVSGTWAAGLPIQAVVACSKVNIVSKTKALAPPKTETGLAVGPIVMLKEADVYRLISVVSTTLGNVTDRYVLDNGQRDYAYLRGRLVLVGLPVTGTLTVVYDYFTHSGSGDFFGPESYTTALNGRYETIPSFKSPTDGTTYDLATCIDFRPRENDTSTGYISTSELIIPESRFSSTISFYVPQIAAVVMDPSSKVSVVTGAPGENPQLPVIPMNAIILAKMYIPAYTSKLDEIYLEATNNRGYTMAEIGKLESRVMNIEDFTLLTQSEKSTINYDVIDAATGLSRFKSGYLVDTFDNPDTISDIKNPEFTTSYAAGGLIPTIERQLVDLTLTEATNTRLSTSNVVHTLPYTTVEFAKQPFSSRTTNINPFMSFGWTGLMRLTPSFDNWIDYDYLPAQTNDTKSQTIVVHRPFGWQPQPVGALVQFSPAPPPIINKVTKNVAVSVGDTGTFWNSTSQIVGTSVSTTVQSSLNGRVVSVTSLPPPPPPVSSSSSSGCFIAGSKVTMADGSLRAIEDVVIGDMVLSASGLRINQVKLLEHVKMRPDSKLYSPDKIMSPFATDDHPLYIDGQLSSANLKKTKSIYPWLKDVSQLAVWVESYDRVDYVYNLWTDGDYTYQVNGYGTTSIIGDPAGALLAFEAGYIDQAGITACFESYISDANVMYGIYIINKAVGRINMKFTTWMLAEASKQIGAKTGAHILFKYALKALGATARILN